MALSKSKKMAKERERLFQEAKEKAKAERQISKKGNRFGIPFAVEPKAYMEDRRKQTSGWSSYHIERAGSNQSGYMKLITGEEEISTKEPKKITYIVGVEMEGKLKGYKVTATSITEAYRKVEQHLEEQKIYKFKLQGIKEVRKMTIKKFKEVLQKAERLIESYGMEEMVVEDVWELFEENGIFPTCRQVIDYIEEVQKRFILRGSLPYC